jgi:heme-degrading monooxygenase HmoA
MNGTSPYKAVLIFTLKQGQADEELKRSSEENSFPHMLARQPGFISIELVRVTESKTLSIQTWENEKDWWNALEAAKKLQSDMPERPERPAILESRDFIGGQVMQNILPAAQ